MAGNLAEPQPGRRSYTSAWIAIIALAMAGAAGQGRGGGHQQVWRQIDRDPGAKQGSCAALSHS